MTIPKTGAARGRRELELAEERVPRGSICDRGCPSETGGEEVGRPAGSSAGNRRAEDPGEPVSVFPQDNVATFA